MDNYVKKLLLLISMSTKGKFYNLSIENDLDKIINTSIAQSVGDIVFLAMKNQKEQYNLQIDETLYLKWYDSIKMRATKYLKKQFVVNDVINSLLDINVKSVILKGDTIGTLYSDPTLRMSNDTDILIDKKDEKKCYDFFKKEGAYVKKRTPTNNQTVVVHPTGGVFECHISMDTTQVSEVWYDNIKLIEEPFRDIMINSMFKYKTLGITDGAVNMVLHFVKHFVSGIAHLRMLNDTVLYLSAYFEEIDWVRFWKVMKHLNYDKIANNLIYIGDYYLRYDNLISTSEFEKSAEIVINDIIKCGNIGFEKLESSPLYDEYSKKRYPRFAKGDYGMYKRKMLIYDTFSLIFKDKYEMMKLYPILKEKKYLLFFMYIHRFFKCLFAPFFRNEKVQDADAIKQDVIDERMKILDDLNMI